MIWGILSNFTHFILPPIWTNEPHDLLQFPLCYTTFWRKTDNHSFFKALYCTPTALKIAVIFSSNPMFVFLATCRVVEQERKLCPENHCFIQIVVICLNKKYPLIDFHVFTYIRVRYDMKSVYLFKKYYLNTHTSARNFT